jgi:shikimate kinase
VLTGFMGTGKSSVARELSRLTGRPVVDVDAEIEKTHGRISDIFKDQGEPRFRDLETEALGRIASRKNIIISTGGGCVLKKENMEILRRSGIIFCLKAAPETILRRTRSTDDRPLLRAPDPLAKIKEMLSAREPFYNKADYSVDTESKNPEEIAREIMELSCK